MAGGNWISQNKKQPGVYINVVSQASPVASIGDRGIVTICEPLSWGPEGVVQEISAGDDYTPFIGYDQTAPQARFLNEIFTGTDHTNPPVKVLLYRPAGSGAAAATVTSGTLTATAKYKGLRGNDLSIAILDAGDETNFIVQTFLAGDLVNEQTVSDVSKLAANDWVIFSGTGAPVAAAGKPLAGGLDGTVSATNYSDYLTAIEPYTFHILIYDGTDDTVQRAVSVFIQRMRNSVGRKCQAVMAGIQSNTEAVISVQNGYVLNDGTEISAEQATWWVGGAEAGASYNQSLVFGVHPRAVNVAERYTSDQIDAYLDQGQIVLIEEFGAVKIVSDINTLTTFTPEKSADFALNQVVRTLDAIANDTYEEFSQNYIGRIQNNDAGRDLLKSWIVGYMNELQANGAIQDFSADDVTVSAGTALNSVVITLNIRPVAAVEKIYITVSLVDAA